MNEASSGAARSVGRRTALRWGFTGAAAAGLTMVGLGTATAEAGGVDDTTGRGGPGHGGPGHGSPGRDEKLRPGSPRSVGLDPAVVAAALATVRTYEVPRPDGTLLLPGAVGLYAHHARIVGTDVSGFARLYADATQQLPPRERIPMRRSTIFDLASLSKLFTSIVAVQQIEAGRLDLSATVASYLPAFAANGKQDVTIEMLLTHTSGFTSWLPLYSKYPDVASRFQAVLDAPLANPAGSTYLYSDLNMISMQLVLQHLTGRTLDVLVHDGITRPLGMRDTMYNPPARLRHRIAATEFQAVPARGLVWGEVHDENAWSLDGVAGHAGVFSTADDLAVLAQTLINGGHYGRARILDEAGVALLATDRNQEFPGHAHGLGFEIDQPAYMGRLSGPNTVGHTGYTGTTITIDLAQRSFAIFLSNRVHPSRNNGSIQAVRAEFASGLADAR